MTVSYTHLDVYKRQLTGTPASQFRGGSDILKKDAEELCREMLGKLLNISDYHRIFFTSGATESMNTCLLYTS